MSTYVKALLDKLEKLKREQRAVILAHNYMLPEIQDAADYVGDSLELAVKAMETNADVIVLAGVRFMAEVAKLLNPDRIVLHPEPAAGCPLADFATPRLLREAKQEHPGAPLVIYVNSYVEAKAEADYVVTSASAIDAVKRLEAEKILFAPDKNLAEWVQENVPEKQVIPVPRHGHCPVHEYLVSGYYVRLVKEQHPEARVLVHPEAPRDARRLADYIGSTSQMLRYIGRTDPKGSYIIGTEEGLAYRAKRLYPDATVYPVSARTVCIDMKKITLEKIVRSLETLKPQVEIPSNIAKRAREAVERGLELVGKKPRK